MEWRGSIVSGCGCCWGYCGLGWLVKLVVLPDVGGVEHFVVMLQLRAARSWRPTLIGATPPTMLPRELRLHV
jgi:hypothetical protein